MSLRDYLAEQQKLVDAHLDRLAPPETQAPQTIHRAMRYSLFAGGKRIRPILCLEAARASGVEPADADFTAACSLEFIHTYSLIHDDLPALDNDDYRRGKLTSHKVFGEAMAILAGDAMVTMAFEVLAADADPAALPGLIRELAEASGPQGMIGGQVLDIDGENQRLSLPELQRIHRMKTGALLTASCRLGAIAARREDLLPAMTEFGRHLGLAFQIVDDVLDVTSTPEQMGKATGKDAGKGKNTYPSLLGLEESRHEADNQLRAALQSLEPIGHAGAGLAALAKFVVERKS